MEESSRQQVKKYRRDKLIISLIVLVFSTALFAYLGGGKGESQVAESAGGLSEEIPDIGEGVTIGRTKRDNIAIAEGMDKERSERESASSSSFDWFDGDTAEVVTPHTKVSAEADIARARQRSDSLLSAMGAGRVEERRSEVKPVEKSASSAASGVRVRRSASVDAARETSEDYAERRRRETDSLRAEKHKALAGSVAKSQKAGEKADGKVEKPSEVSVDSRERKVGFYGIEGEGKAKSDNIRAVVHGEHKNLRSGATVKLRLLDNIRVGEWRVPKNTFVYGVLSFAKGRAQIHIENINLDNNIIPFKGTIYDKDGFEGVYVPDNITDETTRRAASDAVSSLSVDVSSPSSLINSGVNAVTGAIKSSVSGSVREERITISTNYQLTIKQRR